MEWKIMARYKTIKGKKYREIVGVNADGSRNYIYVLPKKRKKKRGR